MNKEQIEKALQKKFKASLKDKAKRHIIFWYDEEKTFKEIVEKIVLKDVKIHQLHKNYFATKYLLEEQDTTSNYLIYADSRKPINEENWLLDISLYGSEFLADKASMIMNELDMDNQALKPFFKKYHKFFNSQKRTNALKDMIGKNWGENEFAKGLLAVLTNQKSPNIEDIVRAVLVEGFEENKNSFWQDIKKYFNGNIFWGLVSDEYGYKDKKPSLRSLFWTLTLTYFKTTSHFDFPNEWSIYLNKIKNNSVSLINHWMNLSNYSKVYNDYAQELENQLKIVEKSATWAIEEYIETDAFPIFDKLLILQIVDIIGNGVESYDKHLEYINIRKTKHWFSEFEYAYKALEYAILIKQFKQQHKDEFPSKSPREHFELYTNEYYKVDQYYRLFYTYCDKAPQREILKSIRKEVENLYTNWFLPKLSVQWDKAIKIELGKKWPVPGIQQQKDFYEDIISPIITKNNRERVFVFISDAMRYEIAQQLNEELKIEPKLYGSSDLSSMQGVIPSITKFGMTSLLPRKNIEIDKKGKVLINKIDSSSIQARDRILKQHKPNAIAIKWTNLKELARDEARKLIKGCKVVYIYHNVIDAIGDQAKTELKTFEAVEKAINEIKDAIKRICNELNGSRVLVVSDHGFIYKRNSLEETDKIKIENINIIDSGSRFILTDEMKKIKGAISFDINYLLDKPFKVVVPNGYMRIKRSGGGQNYVHGGSSLQEITIPLIQYKHIRKGLAKRDQITRKVDIELNNQHRIITNNIFTLTFIQTKKVNGKNTPRTVKIGIWDPEKQEIISDEKLLIANSVSDNVEKRQYKIVLRLKKGNYSKTKDYCLLLKEKGQIEPYLKIPFIINIIISSEFD